MDKQQFEYALQKSPCGVLLLDDKGAVAWVNEILCNTLKIQAKNILGKTVSDVDETLQMLFEDEGNLEAADDSYHLAIVTQALEDGWRAQFVQDMSITRRLVRERDNLKQQIREISLVDELTGSLNYLGLMNALEPQVARSRRYGNTLSILLVQLDNYAEIIKSHGPLVAEKVLVNITHVLNDQMRWADISGRLSDSEFMLILPETPEDIASQLANKIRERFTHIRMSDMGGKSLEIMTRFGMAQWQKGEDLRVLMQRARDNAQGDVNTPVALQG